MAQRSTELGALEKRKKARVAATGPLPRGRGLAVSRGLVDGWSEGICHLFYMHWRFFLINICK